MLTFPSCRKVSRGLCAWVLMLLAVGATMRAQTTVQGRLVLHPISNDDIAAYKLPAGTQRSGGLSTVGLGQPAYLEAQVDATVAQSDIVAVDWNLSRKPASSSAFLVDGPIGPDVPSYEPSDRTAFRVAGRKMLRPDVQGRYTVIATITTAAGVVVTPALTVQAATYMGIQACSACHSGGPKDTTWSMVNSWAKTSHASIFKDGLNGDASSHYGPSCLGCHTVGYDTDPGANNGGFDDVAAQLKWTFPKELKPGTYDAQPSAIKNIGNIQCENCHGPGSRHIANGGSPFMISVSYGSGACGQCHGALTHHFKMGEWVNSGHANATRDPSGAGREGCVGCHTAAGFTAKMKGRAIDNTTYDAINCQTCHDPHGRSTPSNTAHLVRNVAALKLADGTAVTNAGVGTLCMNCHQSRRDAASYVPSTAGSARFGPHHGTQGDMLVGANAFTYGLKIPSSAHGDMVEDTCVHCHMQAITSPDAAFTKAGGHTFKMSWTDADGNKHDLVAPCQKCHGPDVSSFNFPLFDYDGDGNIDGVQTEVQHLLDQLALRLPPVGTPKTSLSIDSSWTQPQLQAAYNWIFVHDDGSLGIHNTAYAVNLLKISIATLPPPPSK